MKRVVITGPDQVEVDHVQPPRPEATQALVDVQQVGICGGDIATMAGLNPIASYPLTPGHECAGRVRQAPSDSGLSEGQGVLVYPTVSCRDCAACRDNRFNHCAAMRVLGMSHPDGCATEQIALDPRQLVPIREDVFATYGALVEPMAVAAHVNRRGKTRPGDRVLVIGAGAIGTTTALAARALGAAQVLLVDQIAERAELLTNLGFSEFSTASGDDLVSWVCSTAGEVDVVYDVVSLTPTVEVAIQVLRPGGRCVLVAAAKTGGHIDIDYERVYGKELHLLASRNYVPADFLAAQDLLAQPDLDPSPLVTGRFAVEQFGEAVTTLRSHPAQHLKILLEPAGPA